MNMKKRIPNDLAGASLLGVHNWIKSQIALSNPGASPDYKLSDMSGKRITISDVSRNPGKEIMIEVNTIEGVRRNPSYGGLAPVGELNLSFPYTPRSGNDLTELLPDEIDHVLAERIVAEQGLRRGLHTLNRLSIQKYDTRVSSPTTAALLQIGQLIRKNPSDRTPFTQRTPIIYSPERALAHWFAENEGTGKIKPEDLKQEELTEVFNHKISAKYGLNAQDIRKFAYDVLADFLFAASANRGLVRTIISRNVDNIKTDRETIHKLIKMFPQKAEDFYNGSQRVFVAHPAFIYPVLAESILTPNQMRTIIDFARGYPLNMGRDDKVPPKLKRMIIGPYELLDDSDSFVDTAVEWAQMNTVGKLKSKFTAWRTGVTGTESVYNADKELEEQFSRRAPMAVIVDNLTRDPRDALKKKGFKPLYYFGDIGGFYPTPPPRWPKAIMLAIMDAFLENLPYIINADDPSKSNLSPARLAYFAEPQTDISVEYGGKDATYSTETIKKIADAFDSATAGGKAGTAAKLADIYDEYVNDIHKDDAIKLPSQKAAVVKEIKALATAELTDLSKTDEGKIAGLSSTLTFDPAKPKSILEMAYDVADIANSKYGYNMRGDDFKFVMTMLDNCMKTLIKSTAKSEVRISKMKSSAFMDYLGKPRYEELKQLEEKLLAGGADTSFMIGYRQTSYLANLILFKEQITQQVNDTTISKDERQEKIAEAEQLAKDIRKTFFRMPSSASINQVTIGIFEDIDRIIEEAKTL